METYQLPNSLDLFIKDRISYTDAQRQMATAKAILERLPQQPGLILADEVGMGKTYVALSVAISVFLKTKQSVVIMIPVNLKNKWPNDFKTFRNSCLNDEAERNKLEYGIAETPEEFFKLIDDEEEKRKAVIFLTHGALTRKLGDGWVKLAIIQKALSHRRNKDSLYSSLYRYADSILSIKNVEKKYQNKDIWIPLLKKDASKWRNILLNEEVVTEEFDDPVPFHFLQELEQMPTSAFNDLYANLKDSMPVRESANLNERLIRVRKMLNEEAKFIWQSCLKKIHLQLPLLIFDEAHHLKNAETRLVTNLFHNAEAEEDAGLLTNQFDRMLFLTATPFQLGHHELVRVLERFLTINWSTPQSPSMGKGGYESDLKLLLKQLDESQIAARRLDSSWGKLSPLDLTIGDRPFTDVMDCWNFLQQNPTLVPPAWLQVMEDFQLTQQKIRQAEPILSKYVIRHLKARFFTDEFKGILRRNSLPGKNILPGEPENSMDTGLIIEQESLLPFLLAARLSSLQQDKRPVFAEGLASSYEAFRYTREERLKKERARLTDTDDDEMDDPQLAIEDADTRWYLDQLDESLSETASEGIYHPKIKATLERAMELWMKGEKVLIFCHYIATGKALRKYLSEGMRAVIRKQGAQLFSCEEEEVFEVLEKIANRTTNKDSPLYKTCVAKLEEIISNYPALAENQEDLVDAFLRYMRTPSFLIRFAPKLKGEIDEEWIARSFQTRDASGMTLELILQHFLRFLANRNEDRDEYIAALKSIQPGGIRVKDIQLEDLEEEEREPAQDNTVMANVRLCYGNTKQETRQKLMKTFNSPFFPDILITSSVMAEGVDLHLNCRHIIHHDLCWNPSTLEQRTGRVDRIGAKAEKCGQPIKVYLPYISQTQDEKMYKVVTERERWFNIVMGDKFKIEAGSTDKYAERLGFPEALVGELCFHLQVIEV